MQTYHTNTELITAVQEKGPGPQPKSQPRFWQIRSMNKVLHNLQLRTETILVIKNRERLLLAGKQVLTSIVCSD